MKILILLSLMMLFFSGIACAQYGNFIAQYRVMFNRNFDLPNKSPQYLDGILHVKDAAESLFFMVPESIETTTNASVIEIEEDTIWRIRTNLEDQVLFFEDVFNSSMKPRWYADSLFAMRWQLFPDREQIDSFYCAKATTYFRGRRYVAWYDPLLAFPFGPWKFGGLPGLIIKLEDSEQNLQIQLSSIKDTQNPYTLAPINPESYSTYLKNIRLLRKLIAGSAHTSDCIDCETKVSFRSWEIISLK